MISHRVTHVKQKDVVQVMVGKERGKSGKILRVDHKYGRISIEKLAMIKRHTKASGQQPGGIIEREGTIAAANVLLYCEKCARGVRTKTKSDDGGRKYRCCCKCGSRLDK